jgi:hypothetical protein
MKIILTAALAAGLAAPVLAQGTGGVILTNPEFADGFANRGQCESALAKVRNDQRKNPDTRGEAYRELSESDFQKASLRTTRCEEIEGRYRVVFYVDGFPA